ncbi:arginine--tRNA ligase [Fusibacter paucivorans]|uniref:arginine--tRNA ligase n=1 Tax=Fusibacter paucivorans TaxID=76009 RepID=UPI0031B814EA
MDYKVLIADLLAKQVDTLTFDEILGLVEYPKNPAMGDYAFPCFKLAKTLRKAPVKIAEDIAAALPKADEIESVSAISGFVNFKVSTAHLAKSVMTDILKEGAQYGKSTLGAGKKVVVEYSSVNIAKPFHMGHIRSTMIGESLHRIYKALGYDTVAVNHLGDYGTQFGKLIVAYKKWGSREAIEAAPIPELLKLYVRFHEEAEADLSLNDEARSWFTKLENGDEEALALWNLFREMSLVSFNRVYGKLGVTFDSYAGESFYSDKMPAILDELRSKNIVEKSEGAEIVNLEAYGMPPALITKKDGSTLYMTRDLAAAKYRQDTYHFDKNIYVVGSAQKLHFQQWIKIVELMGYNWAKDCVHVDFGMVSLEEGALSTRRGNVIFLEDVLDKATEKTLEIINEKNPDIADKDTVARQVGIGAVVFQELFTSRQKDYSFSWDKTLSFEGETGPYVQYTHARSCSVLRKANIEAFEDIDFSLLGDDASKTLILSLGKFNEVIVLAHKNYEPHHIARYAVEIAQNFNRFYHDNAILVEDAALKMARLALVKSTQTVLKSALELVCLEAPEKM